MAGETRHMCDFLLHYRALSVLAHILVEDLPITRTGAFSMRFLFPGWFAAALACTGIASAQPCARPADLSAFDVAGLKTRLMVTALTCNQRDRYNDFVLRFRGDLLTQERALRAYFFRGFGSQAQREHDDYITSLANTQSQSGIRQGALFCHQNVGAFTEVMAVGKGADLAKYAASKGLPQPVQLVACPVRGTGTRTAQASTGNR
jgi:hypothetical protein